MAICEEDSRKFGCPYCGCKKYGFLNSNGGGVRIVFCRRVNCRLYYAIVCKAAVLLGVEFDPHPLAKEYVFA